MFSYTQLDLNLHFCHYTSLHGNFFFYNFHFFHFPAHSFIGLLLLRQLLVFLKLLFLTRFYRILRLAFAHLTFKLVRLGVVLFFHLAMQHL